MLFFLMKFYQKVIISQKFTSQKRSFDIYWIKISKKTITRQLSSCINENYSGFYILRMEHNKEIWKTFLPIDITYGHVKTIIVKVNCFFSNQMYLTYRNTFSNGISSNKLKHGSVWECYYCSNFYGRRNKNRNI